MNFSERTGIKIETKTFQETFMSDDLRNRLWSQILSFYLNEKYSQYDILKTCLYDEFLELPIDEIPDTSEEFHYCIKKLFFSFEWYQVYDLLEFLLRGYIKYAKIDYREFDLHNPTPNYLSQKQAINKAKLYNNQLDQTQKKIFQENIDEKMAQHNEKKQEYGKKIIEEHNRIFIDKCNDILEKKCSAYRIVGNYIVKIIDNLEIECVENTIYSNHEYEAVKIHLKTALKHLSDRKKPDYRNSMKESISAVESICSIICKDNGLSLGKALNKMKRENKLEINSILIEAFNKIYGYTSSSDGIRHFLLEEDSLTFADAKYMLISCSAFVNYLMEKAKDN